MDALAEIGLLAVSSDAERDEHRWDYLAKYNVNDIDRVAYLTATARQFPTAMGGVNRVLYLRRINLIFNLNQSR